MSTTLFDDAVFAAFAAQLKKHEGAKRDAQGRHVAYRCTAGKLTIGYGHNCDAAPVAGVTKPGDCISQEQADALFVQDSGTCIRQVERALPWVTALCVSRQAVLYNMCFNMGIGSSAAGLLSFRNTLGLMEQGEYAKAADGMLHSRWAAQVKARATELARQMRTGEWQ